MAPGEIEDAAGDVLALRDHIPRTEAESRYLAAARAKQEAHGERVPVPGEIEYPDREAAQFKACACRRAACPIRD
ncbi:hypothetical protein Aros01_04651 [Streptosporangium roseum]|uniref:hypothetical protein n=1 Tax=Streptosporangium roseum TaxID=2001 RepID=UPI003095D8DE